MLPYRFTINVCTIKIQSLKEVTRWKESNQTRECCGILWTVSASHQHATAVLFSHLSKSSSRLPESEWRVEFLRDENSSPSSMLFGRDGVSASKILDPGRHDLGFREERTEKRILVLLHFDPISTVATTSTTSSEANFQLCATLWYDARIFDNTPPCVWNFAVAGNVKHSGIAGVWWQTNWYLLNTLSSERRLHVLD